LHGNLVATLTLVALIVCLTFLALATIVVPLALRSRVGRTSDLRAPPGLLWGGGLYFSFIGAGFMFVEIGLIQRLSVFLSHPTYALGILLFTVILSTGVGSYLSELLPTRRRWLFLCQTATVLAIHGARFALSSVLADMITAPMSHRIIASIVTIFPLGILLGFFFPTGMRIVQSIQGAQTPWFWALNGIFGVLCSALAVFVSIYFGISNNFYIAAICYASLPLWVRMIQHEWMGPANSA
jgi:hypothetical protein